MLDIENTFVGQSVKVIIFDPAELAQCHGVDVGVALFKQRYNFTFKQIIFPPQLC